MRLIKRVTIVLAEPPNVTQIQPGSGRGNGIAPVTPPTPPDMRFSASGGWNPWLLPLKVLFLVDTSYVLTPYYYTRHFRLRPRLESTKPSETQPSGSLPLAAAPSSFK